MTGPLPSLAIVCGGSTLAGRALVRRLAGAGWDVATIDPPDGVPHPAATVAVRGELWQEAPWLELREIIQRGSTAPGVYVHVVNEAALDDVSARTLRGAEVGSRIVPPLMAAGGAIVYVASVLAAWDTRADAGAFGADQAGTLALMRSLALDAAATDVRVNAVCTGLVTDRPEAAPAAIRERIPLGQPANPDDVADAALFLLSPDAGHITGSTLVVDGGQSLQSWSNAPRTGASARPAAGRGPDTGVIPRKRTEESQRSGRAVGENEILTPSAQDDTVGAARDDAGGAALDGAMGSGRTDAFPQRFRDRTVLITGAAGGLGSAAARRFAAEGARLALLDRNGAAVMALADELSAEGQPALAVEADVTDEWSMAAAITQAEEQVGGLHVVFNNAGVGGLDLPIVDTPAARWNEMIAVNLRGIFLGCKYGVPALMRAGGGAIVNMGSSTGRHDVITGGAAYMASKAAVEAMTKSLALQVAPFGIRANTICPGIIQTQLSFRQQERGDAASFFAEFAARIPLGRVGQPEDVAAAVAFLASDQARHVTGASLLIDGGQTLRKWVNAPDLDGLIGKETPR